MQTFQKGLGPFFGLSLGCPSTLFTSLVLGLVAAWYHILAHFVGLVAAWYHILAPARHWLGPKIGIKKGFPAPDIHAYSELDTSGQVHRDPYTVYNEAWDDFLFWWNGDLRVDGVFFHHTMASGKSAADLEGIATGMAKSFARLCLKSTPGKPEEGKWTKTSPCLDFIAMLFLPNQILLPLLAAAGACIKVQVSNFNGDFSALTFAESVAVRYAKSKDMVNNRGTVFRIRLNLLCYISTRHLHCFFFKTSRDLHDPNEPLLSLDYLNEIYSPATRAVQFVGALAAGEHPLLVLLWGHAYASFEDWVTQCPEVRQHFIFSGLVICAKCLLSHTCLVA